jgi:IclR family transcriptional regulator, acetate operon repressor
MVADLGQLARYTNRTITSKRRLTSDLTAARQRGWTLNDEEQHVGVRAVGAPMLDHAGVARLAIAVQGPTALLQDRQLDRIGHLVTAAADRLAATLAIDRFG